MARHIPPGYAAFSIEHWLQNYTRPAVVTFAAKILGTESGGDDLADAFGHAFGIAFQGRLDSSVTVRNARAIVGQDGSDPLVFDSAWSFNGGGGRESIAPALSLMLTKNTNVGGRRNRGRMYMPWAVADSEVSETGAVQAGVITSWTNACADFLDCMAGEEVFPGSDLLDGAVLLHSDPLLTPTPINTMIPNPVIRTQKQRQARF